MPTTSRSPTAPANRNGRSSRSAATTTSPMRCTSTNRSSDGSVSAPVFIDDDGSSDARHAQRRHVTGYRAAVCDNVVSECGGRRAAGGSGGPRSPAVVVLVAVGVLAVLGSPWFAVDTVTVTGNVYTDADELAAVVDDLRGTPVLRVDTAEVEAAARGDPVGRASPGQHVRSRLGRRSRSASAPRSASMLGEDTRSRVIDADGRVARRHRRPTGRARVDQR